MPPATVTLRVLNRRSLQGLALPANYLFSLALDVPPTNNGSEPAIRGFKLAAKVQGCWRTLTTLQRHCRIRSYLVSARNHGRRPMDAIRDALTANPWMPSRAA